MLSFVSLATNSEQFTTVIYWLSLKNMENMHKGGKKRSKTEHISVNNDQTWKNCRFFLSLLDGLD
jgi:hypothetical protein